MNGKNPSSRKFDDITIERGVINDSGFADWLSTATGLKRGTIPDSGFASWLNGERNAGRWPPDLATVLALRPLAGHGAPQAPGPFLIQQRQRFIQDRSRAVMGRLHARRAAGAHSQAVVEAFVGFLSRLSLTAPFAQVRAARAARPGPATPMARPEIQALGEELAALCNSLCADLRQLQQHAARTAVATGTPADPGAELAMVMLQSLMSARQNTLAMATQLLQAMAGCLGDPNCGPGLLGNIGR